MLIPKRVKRRKQHRGSMKGNAHKGNFIAYGEYGLVAEEPARIKSNQIEAARIAMTRFIKRGGQVWIDIFPHKPITRHPAEARMGSGKGGVEYWVAVVKRASPRTSRGKQCVLRRTNCPSSANSSRKKLRRHPQRILRKAVKADERRIQEHDRRRA